MSQGVSVLSILWLADYNWLPAAPLPTVTNVKVKIFSSADSAHNNFPRGDVIMSVSGQREREVLHNAQLRAFD